LYKTTQDKRDWITRVGSHADRPVLSANINPRASASFEHGRLAELEAERRQLLGVLAQHGNSPHIDARLGKLKKEITRLNREASDASELQIMYAAIKEVLDAPTRHRLNQCRMRMQMAAEGATDAEIAAALYDHEKEHGTNA